MAGAPGKNLNAIKTGLWAKPAQRVMVQPNVDNAELAELATDLASWSMWIAENLAEQLDDMHSDQRLVGLYAAVTAELAQVAAELSGETGIKPAPLGRLDEERYDKVMRATANSLSLILSQCAAVARRMRDHTELEGEDGLVVHDANKGWVANPVLKYLAGHMRSAKRIMREMAANRAWRMAGVDTDEGLSERMLKEINGK